MAKCNLAYFSVVVVVLFNGIMCIPEQGILIPTQVKTDEYGARWGVTKSMYAGTVMSLELSCLNDVELNIRWTIRTFKCANNIFDEDDDVYLDRMQGEGILTNKSKSNEGYLALELSSESIVKCSSSGKTILPDRTAEKWQQKNLPSDSKESRLENNDDGDAKSPDEGDEDSEQSKYDDNDYSDSASESSHEVVDKIEQSKTKTQSTSTAAAGVLTKPAVTKPSNKSPSKPASRPGSRTRRAAKETSLAKAVNKETQPISNRSGLSTNIPAAIIKVPVDGLYLFEMEVMSLKQPPKNITVIMKFISSYGYLSAIDFPFLPFYAVLCAIYAIFLLTWLILCCCYSRDILQIQLWIAAVVFIGFVEEATFLGEYHVLNQTGQSVPGAIHFGELISCVKRALARVLVIIASVGFGIVKPRLGPTLHKVLGVGIGYFILSAVDGYLRAATHKANHKESSEIVFIGILAVTDAAICWWIFTALIQTTRTLRLRRNLVKLSLYRHFTNTLIFSVIASVGFMLWSLIVHRFSHCLTDWKELWVDDAFWQLLFTIILLVMMILWRPSASNQRYAYSPLSDGADDDAEEPMMNEAFEGMKMRGSKTDVSNSRKHSTEHADDDLKWIEDNIPASVADSTLPGLLDSEEEIMNTKYELSKMQ